MSKSFEEMSPAFLGERLRVARDSVRKTQADAAAAVGMSRTTLVSIEQGQRRIRIDELQLLAKLYGVSVNALLRDEAVHIDLIPRFRKLSANDDPSVESAARMLNELVRAEVELEDVLGIKRPRNYPSERNLLPGDVRVQAEQDAQELRQWLGLGQNPVLDIVSLLENQIGIRVYIRRLEGSISGLFAYDDDVGACILLNANHRQDRRTHTGAHELGHFIGTRHDTEVLHIDEPENSREEKYANAFARAFLTPARAVMQKFHETTAGSSHLTRRHIIILAHYFGVSREAMGRRLEELGLSKSGTWDWFVNNGGISDEQAREVLGGFYRYESDKEFDQPISLRLNLLASEVWKRGLMSEGQLARLLHLDRIEIRTLLENQYGEEVEVNDLFKLPN